MTKKLTAKQQLFISEYLIDLNAREAAIRAGYSEKTATEIGYENLTKPHIYNEIERLNKKRFDKKEITSERVVEELRDLSLFDIGEIFTKTGTLIEPHKLPESVRRCISSIEILERDDHKLYKIKFYDKTKALDMLCKHFKLYHDSIDINLNITNLSDSQLEQIINDGSSDLQYLEH